MRAKSSPANQRNIRLQMKRSAQYFRYCAAALQSGFAALTGETSGGWRIANPPYESEQQLCLRRIALEGRQFVPPLHPAQPLGLLDMPPRPHRVTINAVPPLDIDPS